MKKLLIDKKFFIITLMFFIFGALNIITASSSEALANGKTIYYYFIRQVVIVGVGYLIGFIIMSIPTNKYKFLTILLYAFFMAVLLFLLFNGVSHRGAKNWIKIFGIVFQPSEVMKPIIIVFLALIFDYKYRALSVSKDSNNSILATILFVGLLAPIIIFMEDDFGSMAILLGIFIVFLILAPINKKDKNKLWLVLIVMGVLGIGAVYIGRGYILSNAQMARFNFINPCSRYEHGGYQTCNGIIAINNGGLFGVGIGKSSQKYSYIPEAHTDSVFAIIVEEYGLIISTLIILTYVYIIRRILKISEQSKTIRGKFITLGVATYIGLHVILNLGGLFGALPLTGVPLPFLSYGGTYGFSLAISLALAQRVHMENRLEHIKLK